MDIIDASVKNPYQPQENKNLSCAQIAKLIRADIKAAVKQALIPRLNYKVLTRRNSVIKIQIHDFEPGFRIISEDAINSSRCRNRYTNEALAVVKKLEDTLSAYNHSSNDSRIDSLNSRFRGYVVFDWREELAQFKRLTDDASIGQLLHKLKRAFLGLRRFPS